MKSKVFTVLIFLLVMSFGDLSAQQQDFPITVTAFNTATLLPGSAKLGVFGIPVHPGITLGSEYTYKKGPHQEWFQTLRLGYFYHRYIQHGIQLYTEAGLRHHFNVSWDLEARLGAGYLHAFNDRGQFELTGEGIYEKLPNTGRPQFMGAFSLGPGFTFGNDMRLFLHYQFAMQLPFINEYVPVMPSSNVHLGLMIPWK